MGWRDREYNAGREQLYSFFANPAFILQWSFSIYKAAGLSIRVHFWFVLFAIFQALEVLHLHEPLYYIPIDIAIMLGAVLFHEWGHRICARSVGGDHSEWVVWPLGGMIPPNSPHTARATFIANVGGILFSLPLALAAYAALTFLPNVMTAYHFSFDPFVPLVVDAFSGGGSLQATLVHGLATLLTLSAALTVINLFPAYWFDGGYIWQSILWPKFGAWKGTLITCIAGMILCVPLFAFSLWGMNLIGMIIWILIFADCFQRRHALLAEGPSGMEEQISYNYMDTETPRRKPNKKRAISAARKRAKAEQAEQARIDAILDKVKEQGLHSLTWGEKRALRQATERQRKRDLANRS